LSGGTIVDLGELKKLLEPILIKHDVVLYDIKWKQQHDKILEISIYKKDVPTDVDTCMNVSYEVSELLDTLPEYDFPYILDVSSAGIERELKNEQQLKESLYYYVNVKLENPVLNSHVLEGKLVKIDEQSIDLLVRVKQKEVTATIARSNIRKIRMAVKV
jgi:ribosome maturation factor RimP